MPPSAPGRGATFASAGQMSIVQPVIYQSSPVHRLLMRRFQTEPGPFVTSSILSIFQSEQL